eukprot:gene24641-biopygen13467
MCFLARVREVVKLPGRLGGPQSKGRAWHSPGKCGGWKVIGALAFGAPTPKCSASQAPENVVLGHFEPPHLRGVWQGRSLLCGPPGTRAIGSPQVPGPLDAPGPLDGPRWYCCVCVLEEHCPSYRRRWVHVVYSGI